MKRSMKTMSMLPVLALCFFSACGQQHAEVEDGQTSQTSIAESGLPDGAVIAVPLDANGQELPEQADLRIVPTAQEQLQGQAISSAYEAGRRPSRVLDEMDQTSSTESFNGWGNYRRIGQPGFGYGYNQFQPTYYHGGNPFFWRFFNQHRCGNMNYYYYRRWNQQPWISPWNNGFQNQFGGGAGQFGHIQPIGYY